MSAHLTPTDVAERLFGSLEAVSVAAGYHPKTAYKWHLPSRTNYREAGDIPSAAVMRRLMRAAQEHGIPLELRHLVYGADADEIARLLEPAQGGAAAA